MTVEQLRKYYCRVFDQAYSPCGDWLACVDGYGRICLFSLVDCLGPSGVSDSVRRPTLLIDTAGDRRRAIYAAVSTETHLLCGDSDGDVVGYAWTDLTERGGGGAQPAFRRAATAGAAPAELNALLVVAGGERLLTGGAGDNAVKLWDLESGKLIRSMDGHSKYIHALCSIAEDSVASGSEDGTVKIWDTRSVDGAVHTLAPAESECARPHVGGWVGCVASDGAWLVCGGGVALGMWHLSSLSLASVLSADDVEHHCVRLVDQQLFSGGSRGRLLHWNFRGQQTADIAVNPVCIYSIETNENSERHKVTTCCGCSPQVDVFISPSYCAMSIDTF